MLGVSVLALELMRQGHSANFIQKLCATYQARYKEYIDPESSSESTYYMKTVAKRDLISCYLLWSRTRINTNLPLLHFCVLRDFYRYFSEVYRTYRNAVFNI